jgi:cytochrome c553
MYRIARKRVAAMRAIREFDNEDDIRDVADYSAEEQAAALGIQNRFRGR